MHFNPCSPCGERPTSPAYSTCVAEFQSTLPLRGATACRAFNPPVGVISIHTPLAGSDRQWRKCRPARQDFNPHSPCGERPDGPRMVWSDISFQSTLPLRGVTVRGFEHLVPAEISIHTPLAGSDLAILCQASRSPKFQSTLPLRGATRFGSSRSAMSPFQSTLLLRERPSSVMTAWSSILFQSTLPLRGATRIPKELWDNYRISIHVPLAGSDSFGKRISACRMISIHVPLAGSDDKVSNELRDLWISIHVPLVGSDGKAGRRCTVSTYFNPRSPCGERPTAQHMAPRPMDFNPRSPCGERRLAATRPPTPKRFQSTFPLRGATSHSTHRHRPPAISIHVPLAGSDRTPTRSRPRGRYFNPRSPCGERRFP